VTSCWMEWKEFRRGVEWGLNPNDLQDSSRVMYVHESSRVTYVHESSRVTYVHESSGVTYLY
jgi:hypothetical protein